MKKKFTQSIKKMEIINLEQFNNRIAFKIGTKVIDLAKSRNQYIAIEIIRLKHTVFLQSCLNL